MQNVHPEDDDVLDLPGGTEADDESVGTADAADLVLAEIADGPEDIGLDTETAQDAAEAADADIEAETEEGAWALDDAPVDVGSELDVEGEEHGWTQESEGSSESWDDVLPLDDETAATDDGGLEGVEDPTLDDLDDDGDFSALSEEDDEEELDSLDDLGDDLLRDISP